jgi:hypothetical protein
MYISEAFRHISKKIGWLPDADALLTAFLVTKTITDRKRLVQHQLGLELEIYSWQL